MVSSRADRRELTITGARSLGTLYPGWIKGSWALYRDPSTGAAQRFRLYLKDDADIYLEFRPLDEQKCYADMIVYDAVVKRSVPLPLSFAELLTAPLRDIVDLCAARLPLAYFEPEPDDYKDARALVSRIRSSIVGLSYNDDGAIDEDGSYVAIATLQHAAAGLNCSGFAKWVVDGILMPVTGKRLPVDALKKPFGSRGSSFSEPWEASRDPFFGLDWIRNLAVRANSAIYGAAFANLDEIEVRDCPFSSIITTTGTGARLLRSYPGFMPLAGFGTEGLLPLLYTLALDDPGHIYLASVNNDLGPSPRLRRHFHVAVLAPYFDASGAFQVAVFESAAETPFNSFRVRYPGHQIALVRIPALPHFGVE
jgi:hypothetical protein